MGILTRFRPDVTVLEIEHRGEVQTVAVVVPGFLRWQEIVAQVPEPAIPYTAPGKAANRDDPEYVGAVNRAYNRRKALLVAEALQAADEAGGAEGVARNELPGRTLEERADAVEALPWGIVNAIYAYMIGTLNPEAKEQALAQRARSFHGLADTRDDGLPALPADA